jgi:hypothetical protein
MANGELSPFGPSKKSQQMVTVDWDQMKTTLASSMGIEEEEFVGYRGKIEEIMANPTLTAGQSKREIQYLLGKKTRPVPRGPKKTKEEKRAAARDIAARKRATESEGLAALGVSVGERPRIQRTDAEKEAAKKASGKARRDLKIRNRQVLSHLLPDFHTTYLGRSPGKLSSATQAALKAAQAAKDESGRDELTKMKIFLATEALQGLGYTQAQAKKIAQQKIGGPK